MMIGLVPVDAAVVLFDVLSAGLAKAALYVMIALGLTLIFGLMGDRKSVV